MQIIISGRNIFVDGKLQGRLLPEEDFVSLDPGEIPEGIKEPYLHVFPMELSNGSGYNIDFGIDGKYWPFNETPYKTRTEVDERFKEIDSHLSKGTFHLRTMPSSDLSLVLV